MITENAYVKSTWKFDGYYTSTIVKKQKKKTNVNFRLTAMKILFRKYCSSSNVVTFTRKRGKDFSSPPPTQIRTYYNNLRSLRVNHVIKYQLNARLFQFRFTAEKDNRLYEHCD